MKQRGNKRWHSTETSLISTIDFILCAIDQKKIIAVAYVDMSKAFDTINNLRADVSKYRPEVDKTEKSKILKKIHKVALGKLLT